MNQEDKEIKKLKEELKQARELLHQTSKLAEMGKSVAVVAHELSQPLLGIKAFAQILRRRFEKDEYAEPKIRIIEEQAAHMEKILRRLRQYSKKTYDDSESTDPMVSVKAALELFQERLKKFRIQLDLQASDNLPKTMTSQGLLQQVMVNLLTNAIEELEGQAGGRILVKLEVTESDLLIWVADNGKGIPEHARERLFEPFFTTKGKEKGTGLGLFICSDILQENFGQIRLMDPAEADKLLGPGLGAAFEVSLARARQYNGEGDTSTG